MMTLLKEGEERKKINRFTLLKLSQESALTLFVSGPFLVDHIDPTSAPHDLIVRTNFFD